MSGLSTIRRPDTLHFLATLLFEVLDVLDICSDVVGQAGESERIGSNFSTVLSHFVCQMRWAI